MKARLIKRQDNQSETTRQQAATASQPKKSTARLVAQAVNDWKQSRQPSQPSDARALFASLFTPQVGCE